MRSPLHTRVRIARWAIICCICFIATAAGGAPILWSPAQDVVAPGDVSTLGMLVEAINSTGAGSSPTVNGVTFTASDALLDQSYTGDALEGASSGSASLDDLLRQFDYGNGTSTSISIGGGLLSVGEAYLVQVFFADLRSCCNGRVMTFGDGGGGSVAVSASGAGLGQLATGTFVADGASQTLSLSASGFSNTHITAYQIRMIPEPSAGMLVLLGLVLLTASRR
jgi:hypothetical protein